MEIAASVLDAAAVREELYRWLVDTLDPSKASLVINEFPLGLRIAIADVVVVHDELDAYEIKSDLDSVHRLGRQVRYYDVAFDRVTLVSTAKLQSRVAEMVPDHWGLAVVAAGTFELVRPAQLNAAVKPAWALDMLWRSELEVVARANQIPSPGRGTKDVLIQRIASIFGVDHCRKIVREMLRTRTAWTAAQLKVPEELRTFSQRSADICLLTNAMW